MMPINLTLSAFGPYPKVITIDFESFQEDGLFLITGPTGSGKTMIFDAMMFALYGKTSGQIRQIDSLRCDHAENEQPTYVEFSFSLHQQNYLIKRSPKYYLEGKKTMPCKIKVTYKDIEHKTTVLKIKLYEGKNRGRKGKLPP